MPVVWTTTVDEKELTCLENTLLNLEKKQSKKRGRTVLDSPCVIDNIIRNKKPKLDKGNRTGRSVFSCANLPYVCSWVCLCQCQRRLPRLFTDTTQSLFARIVNIFTPREQRLCFEENKENLVGCETRLLKSQRITPNKVSGKTENILLFLSSNKKQGPFDFQTLIPSSLLQEFFGMCVLSDGTPMLFKRNGPTLRPRTAENKCDASFISPCRGVKEK